MPTYKDISDLWLSKNAAKQISPDLICAKIGSKDIGDVTSEDLQHLFAELYDREKFRGQRFTNYEKYVQAVFQLAVDRGYISKVPETKHRKAPAPSLYNKPDAAAMRLLLSHEDCTPSGTILRLAWYCGLLRNEITYLLWEQVDFKNRQIILDGRCIPLKDDMAFYLERLHELNIHYSEYVLISMRKTAPMAEQSVSTLARRALDNYGQYNVRLNDLRIDYILSTLESNGFAYTSYVSGVDITALKIHYLPYLQDQSIPEDGRAELTQALRAAIEIYLAEQEPSVSSFAIRFVWQMGIPIQVLSVMTWDLIDFDKGQAIFPDRIVEIPKDFLPALRNVFEAGPHRYPNIILNDKKSRPTDEVYIQKAVQQTLIKRNITGITLAMLLYDYWSLHRDELRILRSEPIMSPPANGLYAAPLIPPLELLRPSEDDVIAYLRDNGPATFKVLEQTLGYSEKEMQLVLEGCCRQGKLVRVGSRYRLGSPIIPIDEREATILDYVQDHQPVSSAELSALLGLVERRQIYWVLKPLLQSGKLVRRTRNQYCLPSFAEDLR